MDVFFYGTALRLAKETAAPGQEALRKAAAALRSVAPARVEKGAAVSAAAA